MVAHGFSSRIILNSFRDWSVISWVLGRTLGGLVLAATQNRLRSVVLLARLKHHLACVPFWWALELCPKIWCPADHASRQGVFGHPVSMVYGRLTDALVRCLASKLRAAGYVCSGTGENGGGSQEENSEYGDADESRIPCPRGRKLRPPSKPRQDPRHIYFRPILYVAAAIMDANLDQPKTVAKVQGAVMGMQLARQYDGDVMVKLSRKLQILSSNWASRKRPSSVAPVSSPRYVTSAGIWTSRNSAMHQDSGAAPTGGRCWQSHANSHDWRRETSSRCVEAWGACGSASHRCVGPTVHWSGSSRNVGFTQGIEYLTFARMRMNNRHGQSGLNEVSIHSCPVSLAAPLW